MFENRAPEGKVLLRSMMGGACFPEYVKLSDDEVVARVRQDLNRVMGIYAEPEFVRVFRHPQAIPQYTVGHGKRLQALDESARGTSRADPDRQLLSRHRPERLCRGGRAGSG